MDGIDPHRTDSEVITADDVRAAGFCLHVGARRWCAANGIDFRRLMREGIMLAEVAHIDDDLLRRVLEVKRNGR